MVRRPEHLECLITDQFNQPTEKPMTKELQVETNQHPKPFGLFTNKKHAIAVAEHCSMALAVEHVVIGVTLPTAEKISQYRVAKFPDWLQECETAGKPIPVAYFTGENKGVKQ
jgi:hypothetical protein